jgi:hypothetical protein
LAAPPGDRAWPEYRAAILSLQRPPKLSSRRIPRPGEPGWEVVEAYLVGSRSALERIRAGAARPVLGYEIGFAIAPHDSELWPDRAGMAKPPKRPPLWGVLMPHLAEMRHLTPFMVDDTRRAAFHGEPETALANIEAMMLMAEQLLDSGFVLNDFVALAAFTDAVLVAGELVGDYPDLFSDEQLIALAHRLGGSVFRVSIAGERFAFADVVQHAYTDNGRGDGHLTWDGLKLCLNWLDVSKPPDGLAMAAGPAIGVFGASRAELVDKYDQLLAMVEADAMLPLWKRGTSLAEAEINRIKSSVTESVRFLPIALLMPALGEIGVRAELLTQRRDATLVAIALQLYRRRHGEWPTELDALVPLLLPRVPPDRFDGGPMKYVLRNGDPVLYVVGTDRDDDGGRTTPPPNTERARRWLPLEDLEVAAGSNSVTDGDWVLWPPAEPSPLVPPVPASPIYWFHLNRP